MIESPFNGLDPLERVILEQAFFGQQPKEGTQKKDFGSDPPEEVVDQVFIPHRPEGYLFSLRAVIGGLRNRFRGGRNNARIA